MFIKHAARHHHPLRFSALQRAENSSIQQRQRLASRVARFSALQRAENSSMDEVDGR